MATENLRIERREPQPIAFIRKTTPDIGMALPELLPRAFGWVMQNGGAVAGMPFVRYLEIKPGSFTIEAGVPTSTQMQGSGDVETGELAGGELAIGDHVGPYDQLAETGQAVARYLADQGRKASGSMWESYLTDPGQEPDPAKWRTEVCYPLA
jgi:AraC family transcriptional regulator